PAANQRCHLLSIRRNLRRGILPAANQRPIVPTSLTITLGPARSQTVPCFLRRQRPLQAFLSLDLRHREGVASTSENHNVIPLVGSLASQDSVMSNLSHGLRSTEAA